MRTGHAVPSGDCRMARSLRTDFSERRGFRSGDQVLDDLGQVGPGVGQAVEVVLALTARRDDPAMAEQGQVMADGGLALAQLVAQGADMALALGEDQDHLQTRGVADVLQEDRRTSGLLEPIVGLFLRRVLLGVAFGVAATCLGLVFVVAISRELLPRDGSIGANRTAISPPRGGREDPRNPSDLRGPGGIGTGGDGAGRPVTRPGRGEGRGHGRRLTGQPYSCSTLMYHNLGD